MITPTAKLEARLTPDSPFLLLPFRVEMPAYSLRRPFELQATVDDGTTDRPYQRTLKVSFVNPYDWRITGPLTSTQKSEANAVVHRQGGR